MGTCPSKNSFATDGSNNSDHTGEPALTRSILRNGGGYEPDNLPQFNPDRLKEFKEVYKENGRFNFHVQIPFLCGLAQHYEMRYKSTKHWADVVKAHALYSSCAQRDSSELWREKAFDIQLLYWEDDVTCSFDHQKEITALLKGKLKAVRLDVCERLKVVENALEGDHTDCDVASICKITELLCEKSTEIMVSSTTKMIAFTSDLIEQAALIHRHNEYESILEDICVIGLGSIARGEATPYSNLNFMFLVAEKASHNMDLFEKFAVTIYFLVTNLGETRLSSFDIRELAKQDEHGEDDVGDWFMDEMTNGFRIGGLRRGAGHIPTGNTYELSPNYYIATVDEMISRYKNVYENPVLERSETGDLSTILSSTTYIRGNKSLHTAFKEGISGIHVNARRQASTLRMMKHDIEEHDVKVDYSPPELKTLKRDIYRYPSLILLDLKTLYGLVNTGVNEITKTLYNNGLISQGLAHGLIVMYCAAQYARQSAYAHFGSQDEDLTILLTNNNQSKGRAPWSIPRRLLLLMFRYLIPVKKQMKDTVEAKTLLSREISTSQDEAVAMVKYYSLDYKGFLMDLRYFKGELSNTLTAMQLTALIKQAEYYKAKDELDKLQQNILNTDQNVMYLSIHGDICSLLADYNKALDYYNDTLLIKQHSYGHTHHPDIAIVHSNIAAVYSQMADYEKALEHYYEAMELNLKANGDVHHSAIAVLYSEIGWVYVDKGDFKKALSCLKKALVINQQVFGDVDHPEIARSYGKMGLVSGKVGDYETALEYCKKALSINQKAYGHPDIFIADIATSYCDMGSVYTNHGLYKEAVECYTKALNTYLKVQGNSRHPDVAKYHGKIGLVYYKQRSYKRALQYFRMQLFIYRKVYGDVDHPHIAKSCSNVGKVYSNMRNYDRALKYHHKALDVYINVYGNIDHPDIANSYSNIGKVYNNECDYSQALECVQKALDISQRFHDNVDHPRIAKLCNSLGEVYNNKRDYAKAIECHYKAMGIYQRAYGNVDHPHVGKVYQYIGAVYNNKRDYEKAQEYYNKALGIYRRVYGSDDHTDIATSYSNIGALCNNKDDYDKALECYKNVLDIYERVHGRLDHADIATTYENIGAVHNNKGVYRRAQEYYNKALGIYQRIHGNFDHTDIATSHSNIGSLYNNEGEYNKAIEHHNKALGIYRRVHGNVDHADIASSYNNLGVVYNNKGDYEKAKECYNKAMGIHQRAHAA